MKKPISLLLVFCMVTTMIFVMPVSVAGATTSGDGTGSGVAGPVVSATPVSITEFSYDDRGNVGFVGTNIPDDANVYVGAFDENNRLLELKELSLYNKRAYDKFSIENANEYRAYVWKNIKPLCRSVVATKVPLVHKTISIPLSDLSDFDGETVEYYRGDKVDRVKLASSGEIKFTYNGVLVGQYDDSGDLIYAFESCFDIYDDITYSGELKLVDDGTTNGYSIIDLEVAVSVVIDKVFGDRVTFKNGATTTDGKTIDSLNFNSDDPEVFIELTRNGEEYDYTQLAEWDVLTILANDMTEEYFVEVVDNKIEGKIDAVESSESSDNGKRYKIGDKWYDVSSTRYEEYTLKISVEGTFYIDRYGKIVAYKRIEDGNNITKYGYIINVAGTCDEWENYSIMVKLLDESGEIVDAYFDSAVRIENVDENFQDVLAGEGVSFLEDDTGGYSYTSAMIRMREFAASYDPRIDILADLLVNRFVTYKLLDNNIKIITFPMNGPNEEIYMLNRVAAGEASYDEEYEGITIENKIYDVSDETIVFYINAEGGSVIEDGAIASEDLSMVTASTTLVKGNYNYVEVYDFESYYYKVIVVYDESIKVSPYSNAAVIESVDDTSVVYWMDGVKATAYSDCTDMFNVGDIWKFNLDGTSILAARHIASYSRDYTLPGEEGSPVFSHTPGEEEVCWGPVTEVSSSTNKFEFAPENNFLKIDVIRVLRGNIYVVELVDGAVQVRVGTANDGRNDSELIEAAMYGDIKIVAWPTREPLVEEGEAPLGMLNYIYGVSYNNEAQDVIIYKAADFGRWRAEVVY